jgi:iron-sulfur cluster repair protein YtfE (RIC family)
MVPRQLARAIGALRRHIYLEEEFLFPLLREAEPALTAPVLVMLREHAQIWDSLDVLDQAADADPQAARVSLKQLTVQLLHHNLKEEKILYPRADVLLSPAAATRLRDFLDTGQLPDGWVCVKARPSSDGHERTG